MAKLNAFGDPIVEQAETKLNAFGDPIVSEEPARKDIHIGTPEDAKSDSPPFLSNSYGYSKTGLPEAQGSFADALKKAPKDIEAPEYDGDFSPVSEEAGFNDQASKTTGTPVRLQGDIATANTKRQAEIKTANQYHAENQLSLIAPGRVNLDKSLNDFGLAFDVNASGSERNDELKAKILARFPDSQVALAKQSPDGSTRENKVFVKLHGSKEWVPARPYTMLDSENLADKAGAVTGAIVNPATSGSIAIGAATGGQSLVARTAIQGAWGWISPYISSGIERLRGQEKSSDSEVLGQANTNAALSVAGEVGGDVIKGASNLKSGASGLADTGLKFLSNSGSKDIMGAAERLNAPVGADMVFPLMGSMVSRWRQLGIKSTMENLAGRDQAIFKGLQKGLDSTKSSADSVLGEGNSFNAYDQLHEGILKDSGLTNPNMEERAAGLKSQEQVSKYMDKWEDLVMASYDDLFKKVPKGTTFDLTPLQSAVSELKTGVNMQNSPVIGTLSGGDIPSISRGQTKVALDLPAGLESTIDKILKLDPNVGQVGDASALEQLKQLRSSLWQYADPSRVTGKPTASEAAAQKLYATVSEIIEKPRFPEGTNPNLVSLWQDTNNLAKGLYSEAEGKNIRRVLDTEQPEEIVRMLDQGGKPNPSTVVHLYKALGPEDFQENIAGNFKTKLFADPDNIEKTIQSWKTADSKTLEMLVTPEEQRSFIDYSHEWKRLQNSQVRQLGTSFGDLDSRAKQLISEGSTEELKKLLSAAGKAAPMYKEVFSYGVLKDVLDKAGAFSKGAATVDSATAVNIINDYESRGLLTPEYMSDPVLEKLKDIRTYASSYTGENSAGASIGAAASAKAVTDIPNAVLKPQKFAWALLGLRWDNTLSNMAMSDKVMNILAGKVTPTGVPIPPMDMKGTRQMLRGGTHFLHNLNMQAQDKDLDKSPYQGDIQDLTMEDVHALSGLIEFSPDDLVKARQNSHMRDMEKELKPVGKDSVGGGAGQDTLGDPYADYASLDENGNFQGIDELDKARYAEEDKKDGVLPPEVPAPKPVQSKKKVQVADKTDLKEMLGKFSEVIGVRKNLLEKIAMAESSFGKNTQAATSSARGLFQFTSGTWKEMVKKYGEKAGVTEEDIDDENANALMGALYMHDNLKGLKKYINRKPTDAEVYSTHFLGLGGTKKLIDSYKANPIAKEVLPDAAAANKPIFYHPDKKGKPDLTKPRTIRQVYHLLAEKVD